MSPPQPVIVNAFNKESSSSRQRHDSSGSGNGCPPRTRRKDRSKSRSRSPEDDSKKCDGGKDEDLRETLLVASSSVANAAAPTLDSSELLCHLLLRVSSNKKSKIIKFKMA